MSVPARSATSRAAAGSICCPAPVTACLTSASAVRATCLRSTFASRLGLQPPALDDRRLLAERLVEPPRAIDVGGDEDERRHRLRAPHVRLQNVEIARRLRLLFRVVFVERLSAALRLEDSLGAKHDDHAAVPHHRQRARRLDDRGRRDPFFAGVDALEVERPQLVLDERGQLRREPRHLGLVVADNQIDGLRLALLDLLADRLRRPAGHSRSLEDGADDGAGELGGEPVERVEVLAEERAGVGRALALFVTSYSSRNCSDGFDHNTLSALTSLNSIFAVTVRT